MSETPYVDPNSGAAPQPGGVANTVVAQDDDAKQAPSTPQDAEVQRQQNVAVEQEKAKQGTEDAKPPAEGKRPEVAEPTNETKSESKGSDSKKK